MYSQIFLTAYFSHFPFRHIDHFLEWISIFLAARTSILFLKRSKILVWWWLLVCFSAIILGKVNFYYKILVDEETFSATWHFRVNGASWSKKWCNNSGFDKDIITFCGAHWGQLITRQLHPEDSYRQIRINGHIHEKFNAFPRDGHWQKHFLSSSWNNSKLMRRKKL